jgi:hypothetical protein
MIYEVFKYLLGDVIFSFDGTVDTIVDLTTSLQCVQGNNPRSISFMIQTSYSGCSVIFSSGSGVMYNGFSIGLSCGYPPNIIQVYSYLADYYPATGKVVNDGLWHTVLVTYDGTILSIYVDGIFDNTATNWNNGNSVATMISTLNTVGNSGNYLGQYVSGNSGRWIGKLKNVQFYDYVITNAYALANNYQLAGSIIYTSGIIYI